MINLKNDYNTIGDKAILEELIKYSDELYVGYGEDTKSKELNQLINNIINKDVDTYCLAGGTITNVIGLNQMLKYSYEAVITVESSHINVHETGALESTGHKIIYTPKNGSKIDIAKIKDTYNKFVDNHMVMPKALYLANATELGEVYTLDELKEISKICKELNLYFFIDGARLPIALAASNYTIKDIAGLCDMFYIGGTKLGLPYGELLIMINNDLKKHFNYLIKNKLGMLAKGFILPIMFIKFIKDDYYIDLAKKSLNMANILREGLKDYLIYPNNTNQVFIKVSKEELSILKKNIEFEIWEDNEDYTVIRLVTSFNTKIDDINQCINIFKSFK